jgi:plastocyanin
MIPKLLTVIGLIVGAHAPAFGAAPSTPVTHHVDIHSFAFVPAQFTALVVVMHTGALSVHCLFHPQMKGAVTVNSRTEPKP